MPRNQQDPRDPDDRKEAERRQTIGRRGDEHEDIEEARARMRRDASSDADDESLAEDEDDDIEPDLDAPAEGEGPDA